MIGEDEGIQMSKISLKYIFRSNLEICEPFHLTLVKDQFSMEMLDENEIFSMDQNLYLVINMESGDIEATKYDFYIMASPLASSDKDAIVFQQMNILICSNLL